MSSGTQYYISTLLVYASVDILAAWGLNLQFGVAGLLSFAYIVFQAAGAYTAAVLSLGPDTANGGFQHYIGGWSLPFPVPLLAAGAVGALISIPIGLITLRRLRSDYQAIALLVVSIIATSVVMNQQGWLNGPAGLSLVPQPLIGKLDLSTVGYQWAFAAFGFAVCGIVYFFLRRLTRSPLGRSMRAMRDNEQAAASLGKNIVGLRLTAFAIGGAMAGLSGGLLVEFIGTWAPSAWLYPETFVFLAVIIIGGTGNDLGVIVGVLLVPVAFAEATRFLPAFGRTGLIDALQWISIGLLFLVFLWFRPQGIFPERKRRYHPDGRPASVFATLFGRLAVGRRATELDPDQGGVT
jgi:ABC-type branched-subunit amino acid transport system permease subunit